VSDEADEAAKAGAEPEAEPNVTAKPTKAKATKATKAAPAKAKRSAGILLYDLPGDELEVLLVHPGGPFWARKDLGAWSIPKGEYGDDEDPRAAALREFEEETGATLDPMPNPLSDANSDSDSTADHDPNSNSAAVEPTPPALIPLIPLGDIKQRNGKIVTAWAARGSFDVDKLSSNTFQLEWPKGAAVREFPEVDRAGWFRPAEARRKLVPAQAEFVDRLIAALREAGHDIADPASPTESDQDS
jgi:predicted NUDIX family NTP pyrophosphohydrolase